MSAAMQGKANYREYAPQGRLARFAECLWSAAPDEDVPAYVVLPDGCVDVVFSTELGLRAVGSMTTAQTFPLPAGARVVGIRFQPGMGAAILGVPMSELTDRALALEELWGRQGRELHQQMGEAATLPELINILSSGVPIPMADLSGLQRAMSYMVAAEGDVDLDEVACQANLSLRQFRRRCLEAAGLTPKKLCRVLRFRRAARQAEIGGQSWAQLAADCGYCDQAHLIRDFREFSGSTPASYASLPE